MHYTVDYKGDNDDRRAVRDLVQWFGFRKSLIIFRHMRVLKKWWDQVDPNVDGNSDTVKARLMKELNGICFSIEMGGVAGEPVRRLIARFFGEKILQDWIES